MKTHDRADADGGCGDIGGDRVELIFLFVSVCGNLGQFFFLRDKVSNLLVKGRNFLHLAHELVDLSTQRFRLGSEGAYFGSRLGLTGLRILLVAAETVEQPNSTLSPKSDGFNFSL